MTLTEWLQQDINSTPNPLPPLVPTSWPDHRRPTVAELGAAMTQAGLREAGLRAMCLGSVPTEHGLPQTSVANCDTEVVTL